MSNIHSTAIVASDSIIGENVSIGPYAIIEENVRIGDNTSIGAHAIIKAHSYIGENNTIHDNAMLGNLPQDISFDRSKVTHLVIGDNNEFREFCNIHRASVENGKTIIKNNCYFMACSHVAHDCVIEDNVIICNGALVAGHAKVGHNAFISGNVAVHQFCSIGAYAMIGGLVQGLKEGGCIAFRAREEGEEMGEREIGRERGEGGEQSRCQHCIE